MFCSQSEEMHAQLLPMAEEEGVGYSLEGYSHYGEFQALMRKWINREVYLCLCALCIVCMCVCAILLYEYDLL